jgi:hypothetical protein
MGPSTWCHGISGVVDVTCLHVERTPSGELVYRSYRCLFAVRNTTRRKKKQKKVGSLGSPADPVGLGRIGPIHHAMARPVNVQHPIPRIPHIKGAPALNPSPLILLSRLAAAAAAAYPSLLLCRRRAPTRYPSLLFIAAVRNRAPYMYAHIHVLC